MWTTDELYKQHFFSAAMARDRFFYIYNNIRFDDKEDRQIRIAQTGDKMQALRSVFDKMRDGCLKYYCPGENVTVDERLCVYYGKCPFRVYMKNKPGRYGIKIWAACDSTTGFISNLQVYTGKVNNVREVNQGQRVVLDLTEPYFNTGRGITMDNFFTSVPLANALLEKELTMTGTLRANKREIPPEFKMSKNRQEHSSIFGFAGDLTLVSYVPKLDNAVALLTTKFHNKKIADAHEKKKPEIILFYNKTKGGVDSADKMTRLTTCTRTTRRWPFRLFMDLIDIATLNAYVIWTCKNPDWEISANDRRKEFVRQLGVELATNNVILRKNSFARYHKLQNYSFEVFYKKINLPFDDQPGPSKRQKVERKRCFYCSRQQDKKTNLTCIKCDKYVCNDHKIIICPKCKIN